MEINKLQLGDILPLDYFTSIILEDDTLMDELAEQSDKAKVEFVSMLEVAEEVGLHPPVLW